MNKLLKIFNLKNYSFASKVFASLFIFIVVFMLIRFILIIPKVDEEALNTEITYINRALQITKNQINIMGNALQVQSKFEEKLVKEKIENEFKQLDKKLDKLTLNGIIKLLDKNKIINYCSYKIKTEKYEYTKIKNDRKIGKQDFFYKNNFKTLNTWDKYKIYNKSKKFAPKNYFFYNRLIKDTNILISMGCSQKNLNPNQGSLKKSLKKDISTKLLLDPKLKNIKIALLWLNPNIDTKSDEILYESDKLKRKKKYTLAKLSNVKNLPTGKLSTKQIFDAKDKTPIEYKLGNEDVITWVVDLSTDISDSNNHFLLIYTINKDELKNKNRAKILFLLPEIIAISVSFIVLLFLFRRILKNINTLTKTAVEVNNGRKNIRSNVKGEDDIGILGKSFDSMLDFFEDSINNLDKKVQEKTKEITKSLEEKDTLLKEIHHRVKNNLALTISFIELQENEIEDEKVKKALIDIQERIYTMELIHRKLYESTSLNKIPFKSYVIDLVNTISKTYDINNNVKVDIDMEDIYLDIEKAMPCGLVLNELVSNAYKYAFIDNNKPLLKIKILKNGINIKMIIQDNGKGLPKEFNKQIDKTLGLKLINTIVKYQLFGTIDYKYDIGAKFIIDAKLKDDREN